MRLLRFFILCILLLGGCNGSEESHITKPQDSIKGTYQWIGFDVDYYTNIGGVGYVGSVSDLDVGSFSGSMIIDNNFTINCSFTIDGTTMNGFSICSINWTSATEGYFDDGINLTYFVCADMELYTLTMDLWEPTQSLYFDEFLYWKKVKD